MNIHISYAFLHSHVPDFHLSAQSTRLPFMEMQNGEVQRVIRIGITEMQREKKS